MRVASRSLPRPVLHPRVAPPLCDDSRPAPQSDWGSGSFWTPGALSPPERRRPRGAAGPHGLLTPRLSSAFLR